METAERYDLKSRCLLNVTGADAFSFLQRLITADMRKVDAEQMQYACLLTAQGRLLHEFFVLPDDSNGYFLDCAATGAEDLAKRLNAYKLRTRVDISLDKAWQVYASFTGIQNQERSFHDPRWEALGWRIYTKNAVESVQESLYDDLCLSCGVAPAHAIESGKDFLTHINLDLIHAVDWEKGCFVGQEVAARVEHRGLVKKRLMIVDGEGMIVGDTIVSGDAHDLGEVRAVNTTGTQALAVAKMESLETRAASIPDKGAVKIQPPPYFL